MSDYDGRYDIVFHGSELSNTVDQDTSVIGDGVSQSVTCIPCSPALNDLDHNIPPAQPIPYTDFGQASLFDDAYTSFLIEWTYRQLPQSLFLSKDQLRLEKAQECYPIHPDRGFGTDLLGWNLEVTEAQFDVQALSSERSQLNYPGGWLSVVDGVVSVTPGYPPPERYTNVPSMIEISPEGWVVEKLPTSQIPTPRSTYDGSDFSWYFNQLFNTPTDPESDPCFGTFTAESAVAENDDISTLLFPDLNMFYDSPVFDSVVAEDEDHGSRKRKREEEEDEA